MKFEERARNAYERGDKIRALVLLIEGVKRHPEHQPGLDLLLALYGDEMSNPGLEVDVVRALARQDDPEIWLAVLAYRLEVRGQEGMLRGLTLAAQERGYAVDASRSPQYQRDRQRIENEGLGGDDEPGNVLAEHRGEPPADADEEGEPLGVNVSGPGPEPPTRTDDEQVRRELTDFVEKIQERVSEEIRSSSTVSRSTTRTMARRRRRLRLRYVLLAIILMCLGSGVGYQAWLQANRTARIAQLEAGLRRIDPFDPAFLDAHFDLRHWPPGEDRAPFDERQFFARTLIALEMGTPFDEPPGHEGTPWGWAGQFHLSLMANDLEGAIVAAMRIDRTQPDGLVGGWVRGRLCEAREEWQCADESYRRLGERFPGFVPAQTARMRIAARRFLPTQWLDAQGKLAKSHPEHLYGHLDFPDPFAPIDGRESRPYDVFVPESDRAGQAILEMMRGADALAKWSWAAAEQHLEAALDNDPDLAPAWVLFGILHGALERPVQALEAFESALLAPEMTPGLVRQIQYWAPMSLTMAGRPDWALRFTLPGEEPQMMTRRGTSEKAQSLVIEAWTRRPQRLALPFEPSEEAQRALFAHAMTLNALGAVEYVATVLEGGGQEVGNIDAVQVERVLSHIAGGSERAMQLQLRNLVNEGAEAVARLNHAFLEGRYDEVIDMASKLEPDAERNNPRVVRPLALSYLGAGRGREALAVLEKSRAQAIYAPEWSALRLRIEVRVGARDSAAGERLERLGASNPTSVTRLVDLATAALWLRRSDQARIWAEQALEIAPEHPEVNSIMGLIERMEGNENASRRHFRKAWRGDDNDPGRLVELGFIHLDLGRHAMAQESFYEAIMRDRQNTEALRGMGLAYLGFDVARGRRDLTRLITNYGTQPHNAAQRGEVNKALALLHGAREGDEDALVYLQRAQDELGERADVLVEFARYHNARGDKPAARQAYVAALHKHSTMADAHLGLARVALDDGDHRLARNHLERFLALQHSGPDVEVARRLLAGLQPREGDEVESSP